MHTISFTCSDSIANSEELKLLYGYTVASASLVYSVSRYHPTSRSPT